MHTDLLPVPNAWRERLAQIALAVVYQHSSACGLSDDAQEEVEWFAGSHPEIPVFMIDVIRQPEVARTLAAELQVRLASPQAILLRFGSPVWMASHRDLTAAAMALAVTNTRRDAPSAAPARPES
jgi:bacillithiol system protein YtxJ